MAALDAAALRCLDPNAGDAGGERMVKEGNKAPSFTLPSSEGGEVSLKDLAGRTVVL